jgi:hypothetical protein
MDVERIQKINAMALELLKQGLASDREDAVAQAERIFKAKGATEYSSLRETMTKVEAEGAISESSTASSSPLPADEIKTIMERNTTFMVKKLKEIEEKIAALESDMASVNSKMTFQRPVHAEPQPAHQVSQPQPAPQIPRGPNPTVTASNHPRSGSYNEGDVSIEKFFYMGRK